MTSAHVLKLADRIRTLVAQLLARRVKDPRLGFVTVTDVELTGDTREATVFYTVMGDAAAHADTAAALASATGMLRTEVGKQLGLRHNPSLTFVPDSVPETAAEIEDALARARAGDAAVAEQAASAAYAGEADPYRKPRAEADDEEQDH
ncbi:MAG: 30S ribosome-binding factor RbfA [Propionibacterium sp.]|nr:30S ribosome-binding factor RbfA [Propionibacterium sp.]